MRMDWLKTFHDHLLALLSDVSDLPVDCDIDAVRVNSDSETVHVSCLCLLRRLFYTSIKTLTSNQYYVDSVVLNCSFDSNNPSLITFDSLLAAFSESSDLQQRNGHMTEFQPRQLVPQPAVAVVSTSQSAALLNKNVEDVTESRVCLPKTRFPTKAQLKSGPWDAENNDYEANKTFQCKKRNQKKVPNDKKTASSESFVPDGRDDTGNSPDIGRVSLRRSPRKTAKKKPDSELTTVTESDQPMSNNTPPVTDTPPSEGELALWLTDSELLGVDSSLTLDDTSLNDNEDSDYSDDKLTRREFETPKNSGKPTKNKSVLTREHCLVLKRPVCLMCGIAFGMMSDCAEHWRSCHFMPDAAGSKVHIACTGCNMHFGLPASRIDSDVHVEVQIARWLNHAVRVHGTAVRSDVVERFTCSEVNCSFFTFTPAAFSAHKQRIRHGTIAPEKQSTGLVYFELRCFLCPLPDSCAVFTSKQTLRDHITERHVVEGSGGVGPVLKCPQCGVERPLRPPNSFGTVSHRTPNRRFYHVVYRLLHHLVSKHGWSVPEFIRSYRCEAPDCTYVGVARSDVESHAITHDVRAGGRNPSAPCEKCGKLVKLRAMRSHLRICQVSLDVRRTMLCPHCNVRLSSSCSLRYHLRAVHPSDAASKEFLCAYCTYTCRMKSNLEEHVYRRHGENVSRRPVVTCDMCSFTTIKPGTLSRHRELVHNAAKVFRCTVCDKMFKCELHLKSHMVSHEERKFPCTMCSYRAARKANLAAHMSAQHGGNRRPFHCDPPCTYTTGYAANLRKHQRLSCKNRLHHVNASGNSDTPITGNIDMNIDMPVAGKVDEAFPGNSIGHISGSFPTLFPSALNPLTQVLFNSVSMDLDHMTLSGGGSCDMDSINLLDWQPGPVGGCMSNMLPSLSGTGTESRSTVSFEQADFLFQRSIDELSATFLTH